MDKQKKKQLLWLRYILLVSPAILGVAGLWLWEGEPFLHALFQSLHMYVFDYGDKPPNVLVEIARWLGPVATAGTLVTGIAFLRKWWHDLMARWSGTSVAVRGPEEEKKALLKRLGRRGIDMGDKPVKAKTYILLGDERDNLAFYNRHREALCDKHVHMQCQSMVGRETTLEKLHLFCAEEVAARSFWEEHFLYPLSREKGHRLDIVLLGFGRLGRELLLSAYQNHLFHPDQKITYHVFGQEDGFRQIYHQTSQITDPVIFYEEPWYAHRELLDSADMLIVLEQENQLSLLAELLHALYRSKLHVFVSDPLSAKLTDEQHRLELYPWEEESMKPENFIDEDRWEAALRLLQQYMQETGSTEQSRQLAEKQWAQQTPFARSSNLAAAAYGVVQKRIVEAEGLDPENLPADWAERFAELEHIRWCRFHYLHNWRRLVLPEGKRKDVENRIHTLLVDYDRLTEGYKQLDRNNVTAAMGANTE